MTITLSALTRQQLIAAIDVAPPVGADVLQTFWLLEDLIGFTPEEKQTGQIVCQEERGVRLFQPQKPLPDRAIEFDDVALGALRMLLKNTGFKAAARPWLQPLLEQLKETK